VIVSQSNWSFVSPGELDGLILHLILKCRSSQSNVFSLGLLYLRAVLQCDNPSSVSMVALSGVSVLDTVFYRCPSEGVPEYTGIVCQPDGRWSARYPGCAIAPASVLLTPEHPQLAGPHWLPHGWVDWFNGGVYWFNGVVQWFNGRVQWFTAALND
jgi:hypothetical protein